MLHFGRWACFEFMFLPQASAAFLAVVLSIKKMEVLQQSVLFSIQNKICYLKSPCALPRFRSITELVTAGQSLAGFQVFVVTAGFLGPGRLPASWSGQNLARAAQVNSRGACMSA